MDYTTLSTSTSDIQFSTVTSIQATGNQSSQESGGFLTQVVSGNTSANAWADAAEVYLQPGSKRGTVFEADIVNTNCDPGIFNSNSANCAAAGAGFFADGIDTGAGSSYRPGLAAVWATNSRGGIMWHHGLLASGNSIDGPLIADLTSSSQSGLYMGGQHQHVIDVSTANITAGMWYGALTVNRPTSGFALALQGTGGTCTHTPNAGSETVSCSSDERLKRNFGAPDDTLKKLMRYNLKSYTVRSTGARVNVGVIAQEVQVIDGSKVHPNLDGYLSVDAPTSWELVRALQQQQAEIVALRHELEELKVSPQQIASVLK